MGATRTRSPAPAPLEAISRADGSRRAAATWSGGLRHGHPRFSKLWGDMSADFSTWGRRALPVLRISFRTETRSSQIVVSPAGLALGLVIALTAAAASCYLVVRCAVDERNAAAGRVAELRMERANADLQDTIAALQDKLGVVARDRAQ